MVLDMDKMKVKLRKSDRLYTRLIRIKYDFTCQKCGRKYDEDGSLYNLGVSHYFSRKRESVRFDDKNTTLLCNLPCHRMWETEKRGEYLEYMLERLGTKGMEKLELKSNTYKKRDDKADEEMILNRLKEAGIK